MIPEKRVQCKFCGRIRVNGVWTRDAELVADVVGLCKHCLDWQHMAAEHKRAREIRRHRAGKLDVQPLANPFDAVKYDAEGGTAAGTGEGNTTGPAVPAVSKSRRG